MPTPMVMAAGLVFISGTGGGGTPKLVGSRPGGGATGLGGSGRVEPSRTVLFDRGGGTVEGPAPGEGARTGAACGTRPDFSRLIIC
jgi:hypothetical protein